MMIPGHFINLASSTARAAHMQGEAEARNLPLSRQEAVIGAEMSDAEYTRWHPEAGPMHRLSKPELACFLSHRAVWEKIATGDAAYGAVFEDDLTFADDAGMFLHDDAWVPTGADVIKIETTARKVRLEKPLVGIGSGRQIARLASRHLGGGGYVLSKDFAARLLTATEVIRLPVDYAIFDPELALIKGSNIYQLTPAICVQQVRSDLDFLPKDAERSRLDASRDVLKRKSITAKIKRELTRPFESLWKDLSNHIAAAWRGHVWQMIRFRR